MDEGFGRNLRTIFGDDAWAGMNDRPLAAVALNAAKDRLVFTFKDGPPAVLAAEGDCCSQSWIEHLTVPDNVSGATLVSVEDACIDRQEEHPEHECLQVYNTKLVTDRGDVIVIEYRNSSNGYYGGYLVRVKEEKE